MIAKGGMRGLSFFLSLSPSLAYCSHEKALSEESQNKDLGFLNLEGVTHLFSTASPFPFVRTQELLM